MRQSEANSQHILLEQNEPLETKLKFRSHTANQEALERLGATLHPIARAERAISLRSTIQSGKLVVTMPTAGVARRQAVLVQGACLCPVQENAKAGQGHLRSVNILGRDCNNPRSCPHCTHVVPNRTFSPRLSASESGPSLAENFAQLPSGHAEKGRERSGRIAKRLPHLPIRKHIACTS